MKDKKIVFFSFQENKMCFMHILLNILDLHEKGARASLVMEGASTKLVKSLIEEDNGPFKKLMELGLIDGVCKACANQMGVLEYVEEKTNLPIKGEMSGHPAMAPYLEAGYEIVTL